MTVPLYNYHSFITTAMTTTVMSLVSSPPIMSPTGPLTPQAVSAFGGCDPHYELWVTSNQKQKYNKTFNKEETNWKVEGLKPYTQYTAHVRTCRQNKTQCSISTNTTSRTLPGGKWRLYQRVNGMFCFTLSLRFSIYILICFITKSKTRQQHSRKCCLLKAIC